MMRPFDDGAYRWMDKGIEGLSDREGGGAPAKMTTAYEQELLACVRLRPRALGQTFSLWTLSVGLESCISSTLLPRL